MAISSNVSECTDQTAALGQDMPVMSFLNNGPSH